MEEAAGAVNQAQLEYARSAETAQDREKMADSGEISTDVAAKAGLEAHKADVWQDIDPKEVEEYADSLMEAAEASDLLSDELKDNEEAAEDVALYTKKMNQGIEKLSEGIEDVPTRLKISGPQLISLILGMLRMSMMMHSDIIAERDTTAEVWKFRLMPRASACI